MGHFVGKFLYGSQNYGLSTPESDKDYKWVEVPDWNELFYRETLNRQVDENNSVWDLRDFCKNLMKANPNALELLFSVEQEYFDEDFKELLDFVRENVGSLLRVHWKEFSSAVHGVAWNGTKRNGVNPKTVSRLVYFYLVWCSLSAEDEGFEQLNGEMTYETWRADFGWPRLLRNLDPDAPETQKEFDEVLSYLKHTWQTSNWYVVLQEGDEEKCKEVEQRFKAYFANYLTNH